MPNYIGNLIVTDTDTLTSAYSHGNDGINLRFTTPPGGPYDIVSLGWYSYGAQASTARVAIYLLSDRSLIAQWNAAIAPGEAGWQDRLAANLTGFGGGAIGQLIGNEDYLIVLCVGGDMDVKGDVVTSGYGRYYTTTNYITGFPDNFPAYTSNMAYIPGLRCEYITAGEIPPGGGSSDDRFRFRPSRLECYTSTRLRRHNSNWHPSTGILNPTLDAQDDNDSRMIN